MGKVKELFTEQQERNESFRSGWDAAIETIVARVMGMEGLNKDTRDSWVIFLRGLRDKP